MDVAFGGLKVGEFYHTGPTENRPALYQSVAWAGTKA